MIKVIRAISGKYLWKKLFRFAIESSCKKKIFKLTDNSNYKFLEETIEIENTKIE